MDLFFYIFLFIFWTMFGSFASVVIYRLKSWEWWICSGRSHCKTCERNLSAWELIPIFSWLFQDWKCKWCKQKISSIYPLLELSTWVLFAAVGYFLVDSNLIFAWDLFEWGKMLFFIAIMFLTVIYVYYDILYLEIPESVLLIGNILAFMALIWQDALWGVFPYFWLIGLDVINIIISLFVLSWLYIIMLAWLKERYDFLILTLTTCLLWFYMYSNDLSYNTSAILSGTLAALVIYISFFLQIVISWWRWMWAWDLRIAILMWLLVWVSFAFPAWMITYLIGSIIGMWIIIFSKMKHWLKASFQHEIPFGPFLAMWYLSVLFFHPQISKFIELYF